jgi:hypothetical protein
MMRASLASLGSLAACGLLALSLAQAGAMRGATGPDTAGAAQTRPLERNRQLSLSPAPDDLALAEVGFSGPGHERITAGALQVAVNGPFGDDYLGVSTTRFRTPAGPRALVLIVNRPSALLDPVNVRLRLTSPRALGTLRIWRLTDPFTRPQERPQPALCDLPLHGSPLRGSDLAGLQSSGTPLAGFAVTDAVAEAYDVACGLPYASSFKRAVTRSSGAGCPLNEICLPAPTTPPSPTAPPPPAAPPAPVPPEPAPGPPVPPPPGCTPCDPPPGYACPLALTPSICAGPVPAGARRAAAGAH